MVLFLILINLVQLLNIKRNDSSLNSSSKSVTNDSANSNEYDVSMMNKLSLDQLLALFDSKKTSVVYLGRATCSACVSFLPTLQKMQSKYNYTTQYLDITTVDTTSEFYTKLMEKLSVEKTINVNGESKTDKFGTFYGYTPMVFIIKNGKFADGIVGAYSENKFESFLNSNGIK